MTELKKDSRKIYPLFFTIERIALFLFLFFSTLGYSQIFASSKDVLYVSNEAIVSTNEVKIINQEFGNEKLQPGKLYLVGEVEIKDEDHQIYAEKVKVTSKDLLDRKQFEIQNKRSFIEKNAIKVTKSFKKSNPKYTPKINETESSFDFSLNSCSSQGISLSNSNITKYDVLNRFSDDLRYLLFFNIEAFTFYSSPYRVENFQYSLSIRPPPFSV